MPLPLTERLEGALRDLLGAGAPEFARSAKALSLAFTSEREALPADYFDRPESLNAYAAAFLIPNAVKVAHALGQVASLGLLPKRDLFKILDLGAGPGTASLAAAAVLAELCPDAEVRITAIDRSGPALQLASRLFEHIRTQRQSLAAGAGCVDAATLPGVIAGERFDLILAANLVNELPSGEAVFGLVRRLLEERLAQDGVLVLIDPALRESARPLMALRDRLLDGGIARVHAPCLHHGPCPMLAANERDWCHFYIEWDRPALIEEIDATARMNRRNLKMSYLILSPAEPRSPIPDPRSPVPDPRSPVPDPRSPVPDPRSLKWRVVSSPLVTKGKRELWLCGENGELRKVRRTDRDATPANADFGRAVRGDVVACPATDRIQKEDICCIVQSWSADRKAAP